jgi:hypothetical protein
MIYNMKLGKAYEWGSRSFFTLHFPFYRWHLVFNAQLPFSLNGTPPLLLSQKFLIVLLLEYSAELDMTLKISLIEIYMYF